MCSGEPLVRLVTTKRISRPKGWLRTVHRQVEASTRTWPDNASQHNLVTGQPAPAPSECGCHRQRFDGAIERGVAGQSEDEVDALLSQKSNTSKAARYVGHGGCGQRWSSGSDGISTQSLRSIKSLRYIHQLPSSIRRARTDVVARFARSRMSGAIMFDLANSRLPRPARH